MSREVNGSEGERRHRRLLRPFARLTLCRYRRPQVGYDAEDEPVLLCIDAGHLPPPSLLLQPGQD
jgi:hypothetical protein